MDWFVKAFLKASLAWLAAGVSLGVAMAVHPAWAIYRAAHLHMNLLGFVSMMIFGVAYHVIPRFTGHPLYSRRLAAGHWWVQNAGLALMVAGFLFIPRGMQGAWSLVATGGVLSALAAYAFIFNIWRTIDGRRHAVVAPAPVQAPTPIARGLPVHDRTRAS